MPEKKYPQDFKIREPKRPHPPGVEHGFPSGPETGLQTIDIGTASLDLLRELDKFLKINRLNIGQSLLQRGDVSAGYEKKGIVKLEGGQIAIRLGDLNFIFKGAPQDFLTALRKINPEL